VTLRTKSSPEEYAAAAAAAVASMRFRSYSLSLRIGRSEVT